MLLYGVNSSTDGLSIYDLEAVQEESSGHSIQWNLFTTPIAMAIRQNDLALFVWNNS